MRDVVICEPIRTPIGRYGGMFKSLTAVDLGVAAMTGLIHRTGIAPDLIDDVILGHCNGNSEAPAIGRVVALDAGLPVTVPGMHVDRRCGSGLQAVIQAAFQVGNGDNELVVAGGTESMSNASFYSVDMRWGAARTGVQMHDSLVRARSTAGGRHHPVPGGMIETAENLRRRYGISRIEQDQLAVTSHARAVAAQQDGVLAEEIIPVGVSVRGGEKVLDTDEHPRADVTMEKLGALRPIMAADDPDATVTAGNASGINDGAAGLVLATGGGAVMRPENRQALRNGGRVVYLHASIEQQVARTSRDRNRPLLRNANPEKILRDLLAVRDPLYREIADLVVETDERPPRMVVLDILERLAQLPPR